jgi:hypothetical protein
VTHNHYPLFTLFHDRHTYHGHVYYLGDHLTLNGDSRLKAESGFTGMGDPGFTQMLKARGIRIVLLFKNAVYAASQEGSKAWYLLNKQIKRGKEAGLYEKVETTQSGIVLVLSEREQGASIRYFLPHFALRGKKRLVCTVAANRETAAEFLFNGAPVKQEPLQAGTQTTIVIRLQDLALAPQFNYLEIRSGPSFELLRVRTE